ncbi:MAG: FAD-dependent oxidoreductase [Candidatus Omnitrophica bacterium]|nr:FAD-dependent oxidoreductase [Candidatus Omnitrophota bacterium]
MKQFVIIGNSAAGIAATEAIRQRDKTSKIIVISDEDYYAYCRCLISYYLAGELKEEMILYRSKDFYENNNIELYLNRRVLRVDAKKNHIVFEDKSKLGFDVLLVATGARPKFPEIKGIKKNGVFGFRTIKDAKQLSGLLPVTKTACVLGGGLVGLKVADALRKRNTEVKVIVKSKQILSQMLDIEAAHLLQERLESNGIDVILGQDVTEIIGNGDIKAVKLDSGKIFGCSMVVVAKGVSPNIEIIKEAGLKFNEGILCDNFMQTTVPSIYAAGDVCESFDITLGKTTVNAIWPIAVEQGRIAGLNMAGDKLEYVGSVGMNSIEFFGLPAISLGVYKVKEEERKAFEELVYLDRKAKVYKKLVLKDDILLGAVLVGDIKNSGLYLRIIKERIKVSDFKHKLLRENFGYLDIMHHLKEKENLYIHRSKAYV